MAFNRHWFFESANPHGNVVFNFTQAPIDALTAFARGYQLAGQALAQRLASATGYADYEGYPILFLYRHALELYLKAIVYRGASLLGLLAKSSPDTSGLLRRHELGRLIPAVRAIFKEMDWDFQGSSVASFAEFERLVHALDDVDPRSYAFRYPVDTEGAAHLPKHFVVNVIAFARNMDKVLGYLDGAASGIRENWDTAAEAAYELQQLLAETSEA